MWMGFDEIKTGGDGYWGACQEFRHAHNGRQCLDAIIVTMVIPEFENWNGMERLAGYFFEEMKPLSSPEAVEATTETAVANAIRRAAAIAVSFPIYQGSSKKRRQ